MYFQAGVFYGFTPVLIPYNEPAANVIKLLSLTKSDYLIATAGRIPPEDIKQQCKAIRNTIWVVEPTSRSLDFQDGADDESVWHDLVNGSSDISSELPAGNAKDTPPGITTIWLDQSPQSGEIVTFTQSVRPSYCHTSVLC